MGTARFTACDTVAVGDRRIRARAFVVAVGSRPNLPDAFDALGELALTTDTLFDLDQLPRSIAVIGLGNIGVEIGVALARFGVDVAGFDEQRLPGGAKDPEIGRMAVERLSDEFAMTMGVRVGADVVDGRVRLRWKQDDGAHEATFDRVLVALGRSPALDGLDLAAAGLQTKDDPSAAIDPATLRLADTTIFVAGDAQGRHPLQHEAVDDGRIAARNALALLVGAEPASEPRRTPLSIVFTDPDLCQIGDRYDDIDHADVVIAQARGDSNGRSKLIDAESNCVRLYVGRTSRRIVGASVFATQGEHLAHLIACAIGRELTVDELLAMPFYHPTVEELLQETLKQAICALDD